MFDFEEIVKIDPEVAAAMTDEINRQNQNLELIASENIASKAVMAAMGSPLTNKYAEGYPGKRYYGGCQYVDVVEDLARERAKEKHPELKDSDIGVVFISPCTAKVSYVKNALCGEKSNIDLVVSMSDIYFELLDTMSSEVVRDTLSSTGMIGINWATSGGESSSLLNDRYLAADGIENVIKVLDDIETGSYPYLDFIELNACPGGCVGGVLTMENPYIARVRLHNIRRYLPVSQNRPPQREGEGAFPEEYNVGYFPEINPVQRFSSDRKTAIRLMSESASFFETLPEIDCGYCGAPTCRAFADDVVTGKALPEECVVLAKKKNAGI